MTPALLAGFVITLLLLSGAGSLWAYRRMRRPTVGPLGRLLVALGFLLGGALVAYVPFNAIRAGGLWCPSRACDAWFSMAANPVDFWATVVFLHLSAAAILSLGIAGLRLAIAGPHREA